MTWIIVRDRCRGEKKKKKGNVRREVVSGVLQPEAEECQGMPNGGQMLEDADSV